MKSLVLGVMGHVDHGKTALVHALTGVDTDRLKEEKARGMSIVLGFAPLQLEEGVVDFVDMPGHERFVRTMVAGATGTEAALLVVDAEEGPRYQSREHLEIATLLGIRFCLLVITRCDRVGRERRQAAAAEARKLMSGTAFADAPLVFTSAVTGEGIAALRSELNTLLRGVSPPDDRGVPVMPLDRSFSMPGFGTVVTGTLRWGKLMIDQEIALHPSGSGATVRALQIHGVSCNAAPPGRRVAVNLRGVEQADARPGAVLAPPGFFESTALMDAMVTLLESAAAPLRHGQEVQLLVGTSEARARVRLFDRDALLPGATAVAQFRCNARLCAPARSRFVLRTGSPVRTLGGGFILDPAPNRHRRSDSDAMDLLTFIAGREPAGLMAELIGRAGGGGITKDRLARLTGLTPALAKYEIEAAAGMELADGRVIPRLLFDRAAACLVKLLRQHHEVQPTDAGMPIDRVQADLAGLLSAGCVGALIATLHDRKRVVRQGQRVRLKSFNPDQELLTALGGTAEAIEAVFARSDLSPPDPAEVSGNNKVHSKILRQLVRSGILVRTFDRTHKREVIFHAESLRGAQHRIRENLSRPEGFTAGEARALLGMNRKTVIPLLEYLDSIGFTKRHGDLRVIRETPGRDGVH